MARAPMVIGSLPGTTSPANTTRPKIAYRRERASRSPVSTPAALSMISSSGSSKETPKMISMAIRNEK